MRSTIQLPYLKDFQHGLFWNLFDSMGTQGLLILYHILFRNFFGTELHGKVGCVLSAFYLTVIVLNLGLDNSLAPFLEYYTKSKHHFRMFLSRLIVPQFLFLSCCAIAFFFFLPTVTADLPFTSNLWCGALAHLFDELELSSRHRKHEKNS